jgi:hypothetical protein
MKSLLLTIVSLTMLVCPCSAGNNFPADQRFTPIGWQVESIPPQFRNHCTSDFWHGTYCSDHCGTGYQFYYCSTVSFGCCHLGVGYCDWNGSLRCGPGFLPY